MQCATLTCDPAAHIRSVSITDNACVLEFPFTVNHLITFNPLPILMAPVRSEGKLRSEA